MSTANDATGINEYDVYDVADEFFETYGYGDAIADIANGDADTLVVSWRDVHQWGGGEDTSVDFAGCILEDPEYARLHFEQAVAEYDIPVDTGLDDATVRFTDLPENATRELHELSADDSGHFRAVEGSIERVTKAVEKPTEVVYDCLRDCPGQERVVQPEFGEIVEPAQCSVCEKKGPWSENERQSEYVDEVRLKLKQPASDAPDNSGQSIMVVARDDCLRVNGDHIQTFVGSHATVTGRVKRREGDFEGTKERFVVADHIDIDDPTSQPVDIDEHRETFEDLADRDDAIGLWTESLAPQLHEAWEWDTVKRLSIAWLFASPRIDHDGTIYRGDIHAGVISDPGQAKSLFCRELRQYSPKCLHRTATGISSDVGLTAAAVQDNTFGSGKPTLKPGILVRGNGGHVIVEEIDKGPDNLERMNDGLEGDQRITVDKWGLNADLETRIGLFVTGNPVDGHFDRSGSIPQQVDIDHSLLSRFDGLVTMQDVPDVETDRAIADTIGESYKEAAEAQYGDREEFDRLARPIEPEVGRAWVAYARENVHPVPTEEAIDRLSEWFAEDARQLNDDDQVVPITTRKLETGIRFANAFARLRLCDEMRVEHADLAVDLAKALVGENFDPDTGLFDSSFVDGSTSTPKSQRDRIKRVKGIVEGLVEDRDGAVPIPVAVEEAAERGIDESDAERDLEKLKQRGDLYSPPGETGVRPS